MRDNPHEYWEVYGNEFPEVVVWCFGLDYEDTYTCCSTSYFDEV